jgi:hypothetical protein
VSTPSRARYDPRQGDPTIANPWMRWLVVGCGAVIVVVVAILAVVLIALGLATEAPVQAVESFLAAAAAGDHRAAHQHFSRDLQAAQPLEELAALIETHPHLFEVRDTTFVERSVVGDQARLEGSVTLTTGERIPASFTLVKEAGDWKLLAYDLGH